MAPERQNYHTILSQNCKEIKQLDDRADEVSSFIVTVLSPHAARQAQRRGIGPETLNLVLIHADKSRKLPGNSRACWISRKGRQQLIRSGYAAAKVDRARGVRLIIGLRDDVILTVEHAFHRRAWA